MRHTLFVCSTCLADGQETPRGAELARALRDLLAEQSDAGLRGLEVETFSCMSACANPNVISFRARGKAAYLFAGIDVDKDRADILAFARLYMQTSDGWIEDARPIGRLRYCLQGRIPAQTSTGATRLR